MLIRADSAAFCKKGFQRRHGIHRLGAAPALTQIVPRPRLRDGVVLCKRGQHRHGVSRGRGPVISLFRPGERLRSIRGVGVKTALLPIEKELQQALGQLRSAREVRRIKGRTAQLQQSVGINRPVYRDGRRSRPASRRPSPPAPGQNPLRPRGLGWTCP